MSIIGAIETLSNIHGDEITVTETPAGTIITTEAGKQRTFRSYESALVWAYRHGYQF